MKKQIKTCGICKKDIDTSKEFCEFIHWNNEKEKRSKGFYHVICFRERISGKRETDALLKKAGYLLNKAEEMMA